MSTAAIILAAGSSRRLGRPKQQVLLGGQTLLQRAVMTAQAASLSPVLVVVREGAPELSLPHVSCVTNSDAAQGMATSVHAGVKALRAHPGVTGAVLMTCDQPLLTPAHLCDLCRDPARITGSAYGARVGVPAYFPALALPRLLELTGDAGARGLLQDAFSIQNETLAIDIDTEADLNEAEQLLAQQRR